MYGNEAPSPSPPPKLLVCIPSSAGWRVVNKYEKEKNCGNFFFFSLSLRGEKKKKKKEKF